ncbi:MAG: Nif3-like dinuclear metal center hexameric protein [Eubacteriales bacterium]|nr:Nif3-like dinuclear metal center hexameric protein [Eubacteriales bacterium]
MPRLSEILAATDAFAPLAGQAKSDNSGLITGDESREITRAICCLDISNAVIDEAVEKGAELIVSHHPVFNVNYESVSRFYQYMPITRLIERNICAICVHTPLDMTRGGINDELANRLGFEIIRDIFEIEETRDGRLWGYGKVLRLPKAYTARELAEYVKKAVGCPVLRLVDGKNEIRTLAFASGGSRRLSYMAMDEGFDAFMGGDFKHDQMIAAKNRGFTILDCGHYGTEIIAPDILLRELKRAFPDLHAERAQEETDPSEYIF